jgi:hypothetical protein
LKNNIQDHSCMSYICICETAITTTQHKAGGKTRTVFAFYMYDSRLITVCLCCRIRRKRWQKSRITFISFAHFKFFEGPNWKETTVYSPLCAGWAQWAALAVTQT